MQLRSTNPALARRRLRALAGPLLLLLAVAGTPLGAAESGDPSENGTSHDPEAFRTWLAELREEAMGRGISSRTLDAALALVEAPIPRVIELDRNQPEFTMTFEDYLTRIASTERAEKGRRLLDENRELLDRVSAEYGVPPEVIVALWGIETRFGATLGSFQVVPALATLAYDGRRGAFFRGELMHALTIIDEGHVAADQMLGSWAGAMGQNQFMPSSFVAHAVDYDGDGRRDIWGTRADVFASTANYLASSGWQRNRRWGRPVTTPADIDTTLADRSIQKKLSEWQALGVRRADGRDLPKEPNLEASLIFPGGASGQGFLVYENFEAIMKWNRSTYFATAVGTLSDRIAGR